MSNISSPQGANAVTTMPVGNDVVRYGTKVPTYVRNASGPSMRDGTVLDAAFFHRLIGNLHHVVDQSGISARPGDFSALYRAIDKLAGNQVTYGLKVSNGKVGLTTGTGDLEFLDDVNPARDRIMIWDHSTRKLKDTNAFNILSAGIEVGGTLKKTYDPVSGKISFVIDSENLVLSDRRIDGTKGIGGGGAPA